MTTHPCPCCGRTVLNRIPLSVYADTLTDIHEMGAMTAVAKKYKMSTNAIKLRIKRAEKLAGGELVVSVRRRGSRLTPLGKAWAMANG